MIKLNLPSYTFQYKDEEQNKYIFDNIRKKYVILTAEDWVRQNFIQYLIQEKHYPASRMAVEMQITLNKLSKRCDVIFFSKSGSPLIIVECKSTRINISQDTFDQIVRYNMKLMAKYLIVTNGMMHFCILIDHEKNNYTFLKEIPEYETTIE
jgi:hypothetical protein